MFINFYDLKFFVAGNLISKRSASIQMDGADEKESSSIGHFQCVHCATPRGVLKKDNMQTAMDQLFEIRGSHFPYTVIHPNCSNPKNIESSIPYRETCKFPFCYQITFNDKEGKPLMIRGCAETFMATGNLKRSTSDFHCRRIHETLDIRECYCRNSPACFSWASLKIISLGHSVRNGLEYDEFQQQSSNFFVAMTKAELILLTTYNNKMTTISSSVIIVHAKLLH
uniref:Uncharacterized protein n=1 Tax=Romanomermis culicivorax TaxID=13658 RepID=A0A915J4F9_ROMCU